MENSSNKPVVYYSSARHIAVGERASVYPCSEHPVLGLGTDVLLYGVSTSKVLNYDEATGVFETLNTIYAPNGAVVE